VSARYAGGCLCGQVRWSATAPPANVRLCHCRLCQRWTGAPFFARAIFRLEGFSRTGDTTAWPSSARIERQSCARCGTPMFAVPNDGPARIAVALATLDERNAIRPECHIWTSEKLDWLAIEGDLPQHPYGFPTS
jgi:hypothetical protein